MTMNQTELVVQETAQPISSEIGDPLEKMPAAKRNNGHHRKDLNEIFGSFFVGTSEFAIPVSAVQEVVNQPNVVSQVPLAPPYLKGLFNLRGKIIPVIDLRILLEIPSSEPDSGGKVAIIEHGEHFIGLTFDRTGEILNSEDAARVDFKSKSAGANDVVISGVLKLEEGDRLVQLLDPYELLQLDRVPRASFESEHGATKTAKGKRYSCLSFQTGHTICGIDLRYVKEIREMPEVDASILANGFVIGTTNLRGTILPVIDYRGYMGDGAVFKLGQTTPKDRRLLIIETAEGPVGLMVFSVESILPYYETDILPFAKLALPRSDFVSGCLINNEGHIVLLLREDRLRTDPDLVSVAKACQEIYPKEIKTDSQCATSVRTRRRTFIRFSFEKSFALDTANVSEVINRPENLLEPPYALDFVEGILNLRGELITLLNTRLLYGLPKIETPGQKVLIFKHQDNKYGILVDSVDEIIMTTDDRVSALQPMDRSGNKKQVVEDVAGCLNHTDDEGSVMSVLILDSDALIRRCMETIDEAQLAI